MQSKKTMAIGVGTALLILGYLIFSIPFIHWAFFDDIGWIIVPLLQVVLIVAYLIDVFKRTWDLSWKKIVWSIALIAFAVLAMPVYWFLFLRTEQA